MKKKELLDLIHVLQNQVADLRHEVLFLKASLNPKQDRTTYPPSVLPIADNISDSCAGGGQHDFPFPWHGTVPPYCRKCGLQGQMFTITCSTPIEEKSTFYQDLGSCKHCADEKAKKGHSISSDILSKLVTGL